MVRKHGFDVNDWRAVDGFDWTDSQTVLGDPAHSDAMKADRIWPVRRSGRKDAGKWAAWVRAWMNLQNVAARQVQPRHDNDVVADRKPVEALDGERMHFEPGVGSAFRTLLGRFAPLLEDGTDYADGSKVCTIPSLNG